MADLSYTVDINTSPAQRNLDRLSNSVDKLSDKMKNIKASGLDNINKSVTNLTNTFGKLHAAIAGLAIGAAIQNAISYADAMADLSKATGIAVENIIGFSKAVQLSGGDADGARQSILRLVGNIGEAAEGSKELQSAFRDVGVSIQDLENLSEQDILRKTVLGLSQINDVSKRTTLATQLLGKAARGIDFGNVNASIDKFTDASRKYADSINKAAELNDKLELALGKVKLAILSAIEPLVDFINKLDDEQIAKFIDGTVKLGLAMTALVTAAYAIGRVFSGIMTVLEKFGITILSIVTALATIRLGFASLGTTVIKTADSLSRWWRQTPFFAEMGGRVQSLGKLFGDLAQRLSYVPGALQLVVTGVLALISPMARLVTAVYLVMDAFKQLSEGKGFGDILDNWALRLEMFVTDKMPLLAKAINKLNEMLGMGPPPSVAAAAKAEHDNEMARLKNRQQAIIDANKAESSRREVINKNAQEIAKFGFQLKQQNETTYIGLQHARDRIATEARLVELQGVKGKMSADEVEILKAQLDAQDERLQKEIQIRQEIEKLQNEMKTGSKDETLPERIRLLQQQAVEVKDIYDQHIRLLPEYITKLQTAKLLEEDRLRTIQNTNAAIEAQYQRQQQLADILVSANDKLKEAQFAGAQQKRSPLEQQMANIQEEARKAALEAGRAFAASFEGMDLTSEQAQELANGLSLIAERYQLIAQEQTKNLEYSRSWEAGWKDAFDKYMDNATNAATRAGEVFGSITRNMESAIDRFVETGKFSFSDFARSIIQDLIKIELKAQATQILKMIGGSGSIFSWIGSLFGFAEGGKPPVNKPSIVGEKGPELFVPHIPGLIISNKDTQSLMENIKILQDSLSPSKVLGAKIKGFADGGVPNINKPNLVGEQGPELFVPRTLLPDMNKGMTQVSAPVSNTYITNNISAVDAKSVAQLFAENRKTLLGTVEMARKEMPYYNR